MENNSNEVRVAAPNATAVLVLGILSIPACCCYCSGLIFAVIALLLARKSQTACRQIPELFTESSQKNLNAGVVCAWIGLALSLIYLMLIIAMIAIFGLAAMQDPVLLQEKIREMLGVM